MATVGKCRLCEEERKLCDSHILPDFVYDGAIDPTVHPRTIVVNGAKVEKWRQTGYKEKLLCECCECKISAWEGYAANKLWNIPLPAPDTTYPHAKIITLPGIDYPKFKLFQLSLLWRASVSKIPFFRLIDLGPHEKKIQKMLCDEHPGLPEDYGCAVIKLEVDGELDFEQMVLQPMRTRLDGLNGVLMCFRGYVFQFTISNHCVTPLQRWSYIDDANTLRIAKMQARNFQPIRILMNSAIKAVREWNG